MKKYLNNYCVRGAYLASPIWQTSAKLSWSKQVALLPVRTAKVRARLEKKAARERLSGRHIRALVGMGKIPITDWEKD